MISFVKRIFSIEVYKNFFVTLGGSAIAQILPILITPFLAILYGPQELGVFGIFMAYTYILSKTLSFSYFQTIMLPRGDIKAMALLLVSLSISFISSIILVLAIYAIRRFGFLDVSDLADNEVELGLACFFFMGNVTIEIWLSRKKLYNFLSVSRVLRAAMVAILSILFFYIYSDSKGLVYAFIAGNAITFFYIIFRTYFKNKEIILIQNGASIFSQAKRYFNYSLYNTPSYLINSLTNYLPVFFLARNFDPRIIGYYYLADRVVRSPLGLVSDSVANVLFQQLSVTSKKGMMSEVFKYAKILGAISIAVLILFFVFGKPLFGYFFTDEWMASFPLIRVVLFYGVIQMVLTIYCLPLRVVEHNKEYMYWEILRFVLVLIPLVFMRQYSIETYLTGYGIGLSISYVLLVMYNHYTFSQKYA
jgi:O-antigen/teichoic acid export membrane protein